jgi:DNA-directed RNA polymerase specialized sigma24 family protein
MCDHTTPTAAGLMREPDGFTAFANAQSRSLFGTAWLLTGDWHTSEDLVQEALGRMYRYWHRIDRIENPAAYAHTVLVRAFLSQRRRRSCSDDRAATHPGQRATIRSAQQPHTRSTQPYHAVSARDCADRSLIAGVIHSRGRCPQIRRRAARRA